MNTANEQRVAAQEDASAVALPRVLDESEQRLAEAVRLHAPMIEAPATEVVPRHTGSEGRGAHAASASAPPRGVASPRQGAAPTYPAAAPRRCPQPAGASTASPSSAPLAPRAPPTPLLATLLSGQPSVPIAGETAPPAPPSAQPTPLDPVVAAELAAAQRAPHSLDADLIAQRRAQAPLPLCAAPRRVASVAQLTPAAGTQGDTRASARTSSRLAARPASAATLNRPTRGTGRPSALQRAPQLVPAQRGNGVARLNWAPMQLGEQLLVAYGLPPARPSRAPPTLMWEGTQSSSDQTPRPREAASGCGNVLGEHEEETSQATRVAWLQDGSVLVRVPARRAGFRSLPRSRMTSWSRTSIVHGERCCWPSEVRRRTA